MSFDIDFTKKGDLKIHIRKFLLFPEYWKDVNNQFPINLIWKSCEFNELNKNAIPSKKGLYCFVVKPDFNNFFETSYLFYAGKTNRTLKIRFKEYLDDQKGKGKPRVKVYEMLKLYKDHIHFYFTEIPNKNDVDLCEEKLLNSFLPHINTQIPKAKIKSELKYIYE